MDKASGWLSVADFLPKRVVADESTGGVVIRDNLLRGKNRKIVVEGPRGAEVLLRDNVGQDSPGEEP